LAVGQAGGDGARAAAADQLKEARLAFLAEGRRVIDEAGRQPWRGAAEIATMTALTKTL
jgi:hypothetical protein